MYNNLISPNLTIKQTNSNLQTFHAGLKICAKMVKIKKNDSVILKEEVLWQYSMFFQVWSSLRDPAFNPEHFDDVGDAGAHPGLRSGQQERLSHRRRIDKGTSFLR
jgi:hypothetical protein